MKSQLYHCDSDDVEQMKVFVLCEAVTPAMGPLTLLRADDSEVIRARSAYRFNTRLTDAAVEELLGGKPAAAALVGPAGTTAFRRYESLLPLRQPDSDSELRLRDRSVAVRDAVGVRITRTGLSGWRAISRA